jgi:hypothetical protein
VVAPTVVVVPVLVTEVLLSEVLIMRLVALVEELAVVVRFVVELPIV